MKQKKNIIDLYMKNYYYYLQIIGRDSGESRLINFLIKYVDDCINIVQQTRTKI